MPRREVDRGPLQKLIGYEFADLELLERALTHVSAASGDAARGNQRLEFLGDRVLGLAVSDLLYASFPDASEGELSHRLSDLVRRETCSDIAAAWDLGPFLVLGSGEGKAGGRRNRGTLADNKKADRFAAALKALLYSVEVQSPDAEVVLGNYAAVFLDGGFEAARAVVERALADQVRSPDRPPRDPKTALQEWAQGAGRATPTYSVVERSGPDHAPRFRVAARIPDLPDAYGQGGSKRIAEQAAALALLMREGVWNGDERGA